MSYNNQEDVRYIIIRVFEKLLAKVKSQKSLAICVCVFLLVAILILLLPSCTSLQRITVKQEQGDQLQETVIESDTKINSLSLLFVSPSNLSKL